MADEEQLPPQEFSTLDVVPELNQMIRTLRVFEHADKVVRYMLALDERMAAGEAKLKAQEAEINLKDRQLAERIKAGEIRAEEAEARAAKIERQLADKQAKADQEIAQAKTQLVKDVESAQAALKAAKTELSNVRRQITTAKETLADLLDHINEAKNQIEGPK